jgi:hypothetical protein
LSQLGEIFEDPWEVGMKLFALTAGFSIAAATAAEAALPCSVCGVLGAPAPSIGSGVPVALAAGAVLCGMMLVKAWRRQS